MKIRLEYIKQLLLLLVLIIMPLLKVFSQGTDMGLERKPGLIAGISAGAMQSQIMNESSLNIEEPGNSVKFSFSGTFDIGYLFSKTLGIRTGLGYHSSEVQVTLDAYQSSFNLLDSENDSYELRVYASGVTETQSLKIICIPVTLVLNIPMTERLSIYIEPGINLSIPVNKNFTSSGLYTYKGYYPEYNVVLENLPNHGFSTNETINTADNLEIKSWTDLIVSAGFNLAIKRKFQLGAGVNYYRSISGISGYSSPETFQLSPSPGQVNSLMGGSEGVSTKSLGFSISLRYFINR